MQNVRPRRVCERLAVRLLGACRCGEQTRQAQAMQKERDTTQYIISSLQPHPYFVGPLPVQFGGLVALMRRASLTSSLMAPVIGSDSPALSVISVTTACPSAPREGDHVPFLERVGGARAHEQRVTQLHQIDAGRFGEPPGLDQPDALIQSSRLFMVLPTCPCPTSPRCA